MAESNELSELEKLFSALNDDVSWLHTYWDLFIQLYGTSEEHIEIMNSSAPAFFKIVKDMLFNELVLTLNRLIERHKTSGRENACLEQLILYVDATGKGDLAAGLRTKLEIIRVEGKPFMIWRHKTAAHSDLHTKLQKDPDSLPAIPRQGVEAVIKHIDEFMNEYSEEILHSTQFYKPFLTGYGDGNELLWILGGALKDKD